MNRSFWKRNRNSPNSQRCVLNVHAAFGERHATLDAARLTVYLLSLPLKEMEAEVYRVLRGGSSHDVLSEGFGLRLTRKDLQTLSNLNWLNDEVRSPQTPG